MLPPTRFVVREADVPGYHPANHTGTLNRRLISAETVGCTSMEVLLGTVERNEGALPHAHPTLDQVCYMLEGRARIEVGEGDAMRVDEIGPGDACFFPRNVMHRFTVVSDTPVRVLIVYNPPYMERPENVRR
ncbi:MAG: cupin domain-containing protein [Burkholderiales bacterium]|jgi:uncharacterized RmlC-like cupin family protein